mgnify:CR=1 FL=1
MYPVCMSEEVLKVAIWMPAHTVQSPMFEAHAFFMVSSTNAILRYEMVNL